MRVIIGIVANVIGVFAGFILIATGISAVEPTGSMHTDISINGGILMIIAGVILITINAIILLFSHIED